MSDYTYNDHATHPDPHHQPLYLRKMVARIHEQIPAASSILDVGCGDGNFSESLYKEGYEIYGLEMSQVGVRIANDRGCGRFAQGSAYDDLLAPFEVQTVDVVIAVEVVEHLYSPRLFIDQAYEALRPGGLIILTCPYWGYLKNLSLAVLGRIDRMHTPLWDGGHIKHWSRSSLTELLTERGFREATFDGAAGRPPYLWTGMMITALKPG